MITLKTDWIDHFRGIQSGLIHLITIWIKKSVKHLKLEENLIKLKVVRSKA